MFFSISFSPPLMSIGSFIPTTPTATEYATIAFEQTSPDTTEYETTLFEVTASGCYNCLSLPAAIMCLLFTLSF